MTTKTTSPKLHIKEIYTFEDTVSYALPLMQTYISAGFPSPVDNDVEQALDLNKYLIKNPPATFFMRVQGDSMIDAGIRSGDLLIVDRATPVANNKIIIAQVNGEFTVKRLQMKNNNLYLVPENSAFEPLAITPDIDFQLWGVVTYVIHEAK